MSERMTTERLAELRQFTRVDTPQQMLHRSFLEETIREIEALTGERDEWKTRAAEEAKRNLKRGKAEINVWLPLLENYEFDHERLHLLAEIPKTKDGVLCKHCAAIAKARGVMVVKMTTRHKHSCPTCNRSFHCFCPNETSTGDDALMNGWRYECVSCDAIAKAREVKE